MNDSRKSKRTMVIAEIIAVIAAYFFLRNIINETSLNAVNKIFLRILLLFTAGAAIRSVIITLLKMPEGGYYEKTVIREDNGFRYDPNKKYSKRSFTPYRDENGEIVEYRYVPVKHSKYVMERTPVKIEILSNSGKTQLSSRGYIIDRFGFIDNRATINNDEYLCRVTYESGKEKIETLSASYLKAHSDLVI